MNFPQRLPLRGAPPAGGEGWAVADFLRVGSRPPFRPAATSPQGEALKWAIKNGDAEELHPRFCLNYSFKSPSLIHPFFRSTSQKIVLNTAGSTKQISTRPTQSKAVMTLPLSTQPV